MKNLKYPIVITALILLFVNMVSAYTPDDYWTIQSTLVPISYTPDDYWNIQSTLDFTVSEDSCTCTGAADCILSCADNCAIVSTNMNGYNVYASGAGTITNIGNVYNYGLFRLSGGCRGRV